MRFEANYKIVVFWLATYAIVLFGLGYFVFRTDEIALLSAFFISFLLYFGFYFYQKKKILPLKELRLLLYFSIFLRIGLLFTTPNLSDDYFRFVWDGNKIIHAQNPFATKPNQENFLDTAQGVFLKEQVYLGKGSKFKQGMNSKQYYSVYPPFNQFIFGASAYFAGNNVYLNIIFLRLFVLLFDIGLIYTSLKLLKLFELPLQNVLLYALNPLVLIELTQNIHFEGVTVFFVLLAIYFLKKNKFLLAGLVYALAILTKLVPLLLLPLFIFKIKWKNLLFFYATIGFCVTIAFIPFSTVNLIETFGSSIQLYFKSFEFNASLYYLFREIGFYTTGYNTIQTIGKISPLVVLTGVLFFTYQTKNQKDLKELFYPFVWSLTLYYALASIVHPWYVVYLLAFSIFTTLRYPMVWSALVVLSYFSYRDAGIVNENALLLWIEYGVVFVVFLLDIKKKKRNIIEKKNEFI